MTAPQGGARRGAGAGDGRRRLRVLRVAAAALWLAALAALALEVARGRAPAEVLLAAAHFLHAHPAGFVLFLLVSVLRPLLLLPASLLTIAAGTIYGLGAGAAVVVLGANGSALVVYALARLLGAEVAGRALTSPALGGAARLLRTNAFEAVLTMRLAFVPYDGVSAVAGALRLSVPAFAIATAVGSLPGTLTLLLLGAGVGDVAALERAWREGTLPAPDARLLLASAVVLAASLVLARLRRRRAPPGPAE